MLTMLESLNYSFRNPKNLIWVIYRIKQLRNYKKTMGSSEDPSLVNNVDELDLVYWGLTWNTTHKLMFVPMPVLQKLFSTSVNFCSILSQFKVGYHTGTLLLEVWNFSGTPNSQLKMTFPFIQTPLNSHTYYNLIPRRKWPSKFFSSSRRSC